jgi:WD40 repeat protein
LRVLHRRGIVGWYLLAALLVAGAQGRTTVAAQQGWHPPQEPILRIEPGMHWAPINGMTADKSCSTLVTGSVDKTVRVWRLPPGLHASGQSDRKSLATPTIIGIVRPPIGDGFAGRVYAVALSPDGRSIAFGGWFGSEEPRNYWVYVVDAKNGQIASVLGPISHRVIRLAFSPTGDHLAATLKAGQGLRVWETKRWKLVAMDTQYFDGADTNGLVFDARGNLFTASRDGLIRRYSAAAIAAGRVTLAPQLKTTARSGLVPDSIALHLPTGRLAVGYDNAIAIDVYDSSNFQRLYVTDETSPKNDGFAAVAWSANGERLYAAGSYKEEGKTIIRMWDKGGKGQSRDIIVGTNLPMVDLIPCGSGLAFAASDPAFGVIGDDGQRQIWQPSANPDQRGKRFEKFTVSDDGRRIRFGLREGGDVPVLFDLPAERLVEAADAPVDLYPAETNSIMITDWIDNPAPKLDGSSITLSRYEQSSSLAISPDKTRFVLGTNYKLHAYDRDGKAVWKEPRQAPGTAYGLNIPRDGKLVVAAYGDGTVRWHRLTDGQELLALFVHAEDRRWIAWTPMGYYTASPGGESLIGWHINRGWNETADFFAAHRFRNRFYRPDIVQRVLLTLDENKAVEDADRLAKSSPEVRDIYRLLPPVLNILSHRDGDRFSTPNVTIQYSARSSIGEKISDVQVYVDDQRLAGRGFVPVDAADKDAVIPLNLVLPRRNVKVTLIALSGEKASEPRSIELIWAGKNQESKPRPRLLALLVGISNYERPALRLKYASDDARDLADILKKQEGRAFSKVVSTVLIDAPRSQIMDALQSLGKEARGGDLTIILLSGHGMTEGNRFYFLPADADPEKIVGSGVSGHDLVGTVQDLPGAKVLLIDACRAGSGLAPPGLRQVPVDMNKLANDMAQPVGAIFFGSSAPGELSFEFDNLRHGAFTAALIEGLLGKAEHNPDGEIDTFDLQAWLRKRVPQLTERRQTPIKHQSSPAEFILGVVN